MPQFAPPPNGPLPEYRCYGHCIESTGDEPLRMLLAFDSGTHEEIGLGSWLAANPRQVVATNLGLTEDAASRLPTDEALISPLPRPRPRG